MSFGTASISGASSANGTQQPPNPFSASGPFANLDLSSQQQSEIKSILSQAKSQGLSRSQVQSEINKILTPEQQQTLQSDLQKLRTQRQAPESSNTSGSSESLGSSGAAYTSNGSATGNTSSTVNTSG
jgi:Spy/CpxP family protein refolding chaperone